MLFAVRGLPSPGRRPGAALDAGPRQARRRDLPPAYLLEGAPHAVSAIPRIHGAGDRHLHQADEGLEGGIPERDVKGHGTDQLEGERGRS